MTKIIQHFPDLIDRLAGASGTSALTDAMTQLTEAFGLSGFAYINFARDRPPAFLSTYPTAWVNHYWQRRFHEIDPVIAQSLSGIVPFFWDDRIMGTNPSRELRNFFGEAADFGIRCGFSVPVEDRHGRALLAFRSERNPAKVRQDVKAHRHVLHLASIYFHVHARRELAATQAIDRPSLSLRETACLQWLVRGKTAWEIGEILAISRRTVVFHLENAKRKLGAVTLPQAVAVALYHKLVEF